MTDLNTVLIFALAGVCITSTIVNERSSVLRDRAITAVVGGVLGVVAAVIVILVKAAINAIS